MQTFLNTTQEAAEDLFFGQVVIIWARWFVITAVAVFTLWAANTVAQLTTAVLLIVIIMAINFFVHGRYLMEKPINRRLLMGLSLVDLCVITLTLVAWDGQNGLGSQFFIFYYPLLLAFAFVFPPRHTILYTLTTLMAYMVACLITDFAVLNQSLVLETLVMRLITLASMGGLGTYYWRIQRDRRRASAGDLAMTEL